MAIDTSAPVSATPTVALPPAGPVLVPRSPQPVTATAAATLGTRILEPAQLMGAVASRINLDRLVPSAVDLFTASDKAQGAKIKRASDGFTGRLTQLAEQLHRLAARAPREGELPPPENPNAPFASPAQVIENPNSKGSQTTVALMGQLVQMAIGSQRHNLDRLAINVPPEQLPAVTDALTDYALGNAALMMESMDLLPVQREDAVAALRQLLRPGAEGLSDEAVSAAMSRLSAPSAQLGGKESLKRAVLAPASQLKPYGELLAKLERDLGPLLQTTPEAREAFEEIRADATALGNVGYPLTVAMTALLSRDKSNAPQMVARAKEALTRSNVVVLKVLQTVLNTLDANTTPPSIIELRDFVQNGLKTDAIALLRPVIESDPKFAGKKLEDVFQFTDADVARQEGASTAIGLPCRAKIPAGDGLPERWVDGWLKCIKPMDGQVEEAGRVLRVMGDMLKSQTADGLGQASTVLDMIDTVGHAVLEDISNELDQPRERASMAAIREKLKDQPIYVPRAFEAVSGNRFTFMERLDGWNLSHLVTRYKESRAAHRRGDYVGAGTKGPEADAHRRFTLWARRTYGVAPDAIRLTKTEQGFDAHLTFPDSIYREATARLLPDGIIQSDSRKPDLSQTAFKRLRSVMTVGMFAQIARGLAHGDMQDKNFKILPDTMMPALLDLGSTVQPSWRQFVAPAKLLLGSLLRRPQMMARAFVDMSRGSELLTPERRQELAKQLAAKLTASLPAGKDAGGWQQKLESGWSHTKRAAGELDLTLSSEYVQVPRLALAMHGNFKQFRAGLDEGSNINIRQLATDLARASFAELRRKGRDASAMDAARDRKKDSKVVEIFGVPAWEPVVPGFYNETVIEPATEPAMAHEAEEPAAA